MPAQPGRALVKAPAYFFFARLTSLFVCAHNVNADNDRLIMY